MAKVSIVRIQGRPRLGWIYVQKVALVSGRMTVEAEQQSEKDKKVCRALAHV